MSIASEIQRLQGVRTNIFDAITNKGVTVPSGAKLADCPDLISQITGGGISTPVPDVLTNEGIFKNFFPIKRYITILVSSDLVYYGISWDANYPLLINCNFAPTIDDSFTIAITFKKDSGYGLNNRCLLGCVNSYYKNFTVEYDGAGFFIGIPATGGDWSSQYFLNALLSSNQWYTIQITQSSRILNVACYDSNDNLVASGTKDNYSLISSDQFETLQLGGCNRNSTINWNGYIDLKKTYIKLNGLVLWGCEYITT